MRPLAERLSEHGLQGYAALLERHRIGLDVLARVTDEELAGLGIALGDRKRFQRLQEALAAETPSPPAPASGQAHGEPRIRQMSVLFADLVDSSQLAERLDVEAYHAALARFHACCRDAIRELGGHPARYIGDALLGCFGFPRATEDDAERAVRAGLLITERVPALPRTEAPVLRSRVGIATGLVLTGDLLAEGGSSFGPASGATLHLAARLQSLAPPDTVLIEEETLRLLPAGRARIESAGRRTIKGFEGERPLWRVRHMAPVGAHRPVHAQPRPSPLVGRRFELDVLRSAWTSVRERGSLLLVTGEPGIGKSRLVREFVASAPLGEERTLLLECSEGERLRPFAPFVRALEERAELDRVQTRGQRRERFLAWLEERGARTTGPGRAALVRMMGLQPEAAGLLPPGDGRQTPTVRGALLDLIASLAEPRPLLLVLEDFHWADPSTEEVLEQLVARLPTLPVLAVVTTRPGQRSPLAGEPRVSVLGIPRLDRHDSLALVHAAAGPGGTEPELEAAIVQRAEGVPLFLEALTKAARTEPGAAPSGRRPLRQLARRLPGTLLGSLLAQLDVSEDGGELLPMAAVLGRRFSASRLAAMGGLEHEAVVSRLDALARAELLSGREEGGDVEYAFRHSLLRDAAYQTLTRSRRRELHLGAAAVLKALPAEHPERRPEWIARHLVLGGEPLEAVSFWRRAAQDARATGARREAAGYLRAALEANATTGPGPERQDREIALREALYAPLQVTNWASEEIVENMERLRELRALRGRVGVQPDVLHALAGYHVIRGNVATARDLTTELLRRSGTGEPVGRTLGLRCLAFCDFLGGRLPEAIHGFEETERAARALAPGELAPYYQADTVLVARAMRAWALALSDRHRAARGAGRTTLEALTSGADPWTEVYVLVILASCAQSLGGRDECAALLERALPLAERIDSAYWTAWGWALQGWVEAGSGPGGAAPQGIRDALERYRATGARQALPYFELLLAEAHLLGGEAGVAGEMIDALQTRREPAEVRYIDPLLARLEARLAHCGPSP